MTSSRIDSYVSDLMVLIAIFFLQLSRNKTSVNVICNYYNGDLFSPDRVKYSLKRLINGYVLIVHKSGQGVIPIYEINFSQLNTYFSSATISKSTRYRILEQLEKLGFVYCEDGEYLFDGEEFITFLKRNGLDIEQLLIMLNSFATMFMSSTSLITEAILLNSFHKQKFTFNIPSISFNPWFLEICQKALCLRGK